MLGNKVIIAGTPDFVYCFMVINVRINGADVALRVKGLLYGKGQIFKSMKAW